jgi:putative aldouronate transport system substrate-binding protein
MNRYAKAFILIAASTLFLAGGAIAQKKAGEPVTISWYIEGGGQPADTDMVLAEVNKILGPKIGVNLKLVVLPWADYNNKMQVMLAAGEDFDLCFTSNWSFDYATNVGKGLFLPLDELLKQYGKDYASYVPETVRSATKVKGKNYAFVNYQLSYMYENKIVQADVADAAGFNQLKVKKLEDYESLLAWIAKNKPKMYPWGQFANDASDQLNASQLYYGFENLISTRVPSAIRVNDKSLKVFNQFASPEFEAYFKLMRKWNQAGYIKPDQLSIDDSDAIRQQGLVGVFGMNRWGPSFEADGKTLSRPIQAEGGLKVYRDPFPSNLDVSGKLAWQTVVDSWKKAGTARPTLQTGSILGTLTAVNAQSKHPAEAVKFFDLLFSNDPDGKKVLELLKFGILGTHYDMDPKDSNRIIEKPRMKDSWNYDILWETGPGNIKGFTWKNENDVVKEAWRTLNKSAPASPALGFTVDSSKLTNQLAAVASVVQEYYSGLLLGVYPDVDKTLKEFRAKLDAAGAGQIVAEIQRQLDDWKKTAK